jgi:hypothetical protein
MHMRGRVVERVDSNLDSCSRISVGFRIT